MSRAPFLVVFILPFICGSLLEKDFFRWPRFWLGVGAVIFAAAGANMLNEYADSKSRADWQDTRRYQFFGGSKLIQEGIRSEGFVLSGALVCFILATILVSGLALMLKNTRILLYYAVIIFLAYTHSGAPFRLSYRRLGEVLVFILCGPALFMGAYFIQTGIFPSLRSFSLSLPFGFLTTAVLFANEVPDFFEDARVSKYNWVGIVGPAKAYLLYEFIVILAFAAIAINIFLGYLSLFSLFALPCFFVSFAAARILKRNFRDKNVLAVSSRLTVIAHHVTGLILILSFLL
jgi:1,4-dihydroxy-2-naphthoate octaprenyltransferase